MKALPILYQQLTSNYIFKRFMIIFLLFAFINSSSLYAESEPNESCATANLLLDTSSSTNSGYVNGTVTDNNDDDYFKIILTQRAELRLDKHDRNNKKTKAQILQSNCSTVLGSTNSKDKTNWKFTLDSGTYYIRFYRSNKDNAQYKIKAKMNRIADFTISKIVDNNTPSPGDTVTYTITVTNNGPQNSKAHFFDTLPSGLTYLSKSTCSKVGNGIDCKKWLNAGNISIVTLKAIVDAGASGSIINTATVEKDNTNSNGEKTFESDLANNNDSATITVASVTDAVSITKTVDNSTPSVGDIVSFSIVTTNSGLDKKIEMRDWIESGVNGVTPNAFQIVNYTTDKTDVTCSIDAGGGTPFLYCVTNSDYADAESFTTTVQARILKSGNIQNRAYGYKYPWDTTVMDSSTVSMTASNAASTDLSINSILDAPDPVDIGGDITYTVAISNNGAIATGVELNATLSVGTLKTAPSGWSCSGTSAVNCVRDNNLNDGDSENVIFIFTAPSTAQTITLSTSIGSYQTDSSPSNNTKNETTDVVNNNVSIPNEDVNATTATCATFADMFQTHGTCSGSSGGTISFNNAGSTLDGTQNIIKDNTDNTLSTCLITTATWVKNQYETCGIQGDCTQSGHSAEKLTINYNNLPQVASILSSPSSSTNDVTLNGTITLNNSEYNNITTSWHTGTSTDFSIANTLKINTLKMTNNNSFSFGSANLYSLNIGTIGIENNGADNTILTDDNARDIKINNLTLKSGTTLTLKATQSIKMDTLSVGYGSNIIIKAQYVNINNFILDGSGSGDATVQIIADYVDIGDLNIHNHSSGATITIKPYTPNKRLLFKSNSIEEGSNSTLIFYSGNYYVNSSISLPGTSDVSAMRAYDANQVINLFINNSLNPGNNPGINSTGNNGNFGTNPAANFLLFVNGDLTTGGGGTTLNATIYIEGNATFGNSTYIKGALSANTSIDIGQGQFIYDQNINNNGWGKCSSSYCDTNNFSEGFKLIDPDGGSEINSFEIFCHEDNNGWHDLIALPIKNDSNNFLFNNNATSSNYYDTTANPRAHFHAIEINANDITYSGTLDDGITPSPQIPVVVSANAEPYSITTDGNNYNVMGSNFSNINLIGTPFKIDWSTTGVLGSCDESKLRKALGQAVKYNTINLTSTSNDSLSRCEISTMKLSLVGDYHFLTYGGSEVLQHSCKEMATFVPTNVLNDASVDGHFNILTTEPAYVDTTPTTNGTRDSNLDIGATLRPLTVYCKYQTDLSYVWTFLTALDAKVTQSKSDLVSGSDTCSELGLYFYVPNNKVTFNRVREYLKDKKTGDDGWENYTGTIEEKIQALHTGNPYYLSAFKDVIIWPYGPLGVYYPTNGWQSGVNSWWSGTRDVKAWMSGSPMHNISTMSNYTDSMGYKGFVSILGSQDLNKTNDWWIADIGAGEEIGLASPLYSPHGTHPIQSTNYFYYEPNGNYTANSWLNFLFDSEGWIYHNDDWYDNYPYYDYMCMSETNYDEASRYALVPGFFNAIERGTRTGNTSPNFSDDNLTTQIVSKPIQLDIILYPYSLVDGNIIADKSQLEVDQNKSVGVFLSTAEGNTTAIPQQFIGAYEDFDGNNGRITLPDINMTSANKFMLLQFYYCDTADTNWTQCWSYNGIADAPTVTELNSSDTGRTDSFDDFAVRPKYFSIVNLAGTTTVKADDVNLSYYAYDYNNTASARYNEFFTSLDVNSTLANSDKNCTTNTLSLALPTQFRNGVEHNVTTLGSVGVFNVAINEINGSEYAVIDADDTPDIDRFITPADINLTIIPHHFSITSITKINAGSNFTYISNDLDNMALKFDFNVTAQNSADAITPNYSSECYAKDINLDLNYSVAEGEMAELIIYKELNSGIEGNNTADINSSSLPAGADILPSTLFTNDNNGTAALSLRVNFKRDVNNSLNPFVVNFNDLNISDQTTPSLIIYNENSHDIDLDGNMVYGRTHAQRQRFEGTDGNVTINYEVFCNGSDCNTSLLPSGADSNTTDDPRWFINTSHVNTNDGIVGTISQKGGAGIVTANPATSPTTTLHYNATKGYPYKTTMENNASSWLIYNKYDDSDDTNEFDVEFIGTGGWAGKSDTNVTTGSDASKITNRRSMW